jgi:hypothetical protein
LIYEKQFQNRISCSDIFFSCNAYSFSLDVHPKEINDDLRAEDLAVTDTAYFNPADFCLKNDSLFLPSVASLKSRSEYAFVIRISLLPGDELEGETVSPSSKDEFSSDDVDLFIKRLREPVGRLFARQALYCSDYDDFHDEDIFFYRLLTIDGHESLSEIINDLRSRNYDYGGE